MSYSVRFSKSAKEILTKWKKLNPKLFKKTSSMLEELAEHPKTGIGHPEPLVGGNGITYSRRISANERIVYDIYEDCIQVIVLTIGGHYDDK